MLYPPLSPVSPPNHHNSDSLQNLLVTSAAAASYGGLPILTPKPAGSGSSSQQQQQQLLRSVSPGIAARKGSEERNIKVDMSEFALFKITNNIKTDMSEFVCEILFFAILLICAKARLMIVF
jgi:hypothetical protein